MLIFYVYVLLLPCRKVSACLAGDSAAYQRTSLYGDDVVIVALSFSLSLFFFGLLLKKKNQLFSKRLFVIDETLNRAQRTALCKAKRGSFKDTYPDELLAPVLRVCLSLSSILFCFSPLFSKVVAFCWQAVIEKTKLNPSEVGDIVVGTVLGSGSQKATEFRMAAFYAGFPGERFLVYLGDL